MWRLSGGCARCRAAGITTERRAVPMTRMSIGGARTGTSSVCPPPASSVRALGRTTVAETLITARESWVGDPVRPGLDAPTPAEVVAELSREDRALRVRNLTAQAHQVVDLALEEH